MVRRPVRTIRKDWQKKVEDIGFHFYEIDGLPYWDESVYYEFTSEQVDRIEDVTLALNELCLEFVDHVVRENLLGRFAIPEQYWDYVRASWQEDQPSIYGRFDLWYDGKNEPKLLEFNADTPTALFEASVVQYYWLQDFDSGKDQFNSIHEKLLDLYSGKLAPRTKSSIFYFSCVKESLEDYTTTEYLRDVAIQAGLETEHIFIDEIGYDYDSSRFVDLEDREIRYLFKLYPWEWMLSERFAEFLPSNGIVLYEPAWKMILSNKAILPMLWDRHPNHPNLLPAYFAPPCSTVPFVQKPFFSREGAGIIAGTNFSGLDKQVVYQQYLELPNFDGNYPVIGSWIVGSQAAGMGIREDSTPITNNLSRFVPHLFSY